ncbi:MAG: hypothetical protein DRI90_11485 [Deltaproteobacteria bacterium]|nr:MAG: hypothetical protein DRI90_11485 [Deltaproteobacteria bacterium]
MAEAVGGWPRLIAPLGVVGALVGGGILASSVPFVLDTFGDSSLVVGVVVASMALFFLVYTGLFFLIRRRAQRHVLARTLSWSQSLPFSLEGFPEWLASGPASVSYLRLVSQTEAPQSLIMDSMKALLPDREADWITSREVEFRLSHKWIHGRSRHHAGHHRPDLPKLKEIVRRLLIPLHGSSWPLESVSLTFPS